jgi:hypothetical protein
MAKDRRSRDQKRKAKLTRRTDRQRGDGPQPYAGKKYQGQRWVPHVYQTELAVYEAVLRSGRGLTNVQVRAAFVELIEHLRRGLSPLLPPDALAVPFAPGNEVHFLVWNIRRHWGLLFEEQGPVDPEDLIGILRTLLFSIEAQAWARGKDRGYVDFLYHFMQQRPV